MAILEGIVSLSSEEQPEVVSQADVFAGELPFLSVVNTGKSGKIIRIPEASLCTQLESQSKGSYQLYLHVIEAPA
jgi:hypothetical protein